MPASPSEQNIQYGAGVLRIKVDDVDEVLRHVGNMTSMNLSADIETIDKKQTMSGLKTTYIKITTELSKTLEAVLDEVTPENMALFVMGTQSTNTDGDVEISGGTQTEMLCDFEYTSDNPNGRQMIFSGRGQITPNGDFSFITDGLTSIPISIAILKDGGEFGHWRFPAEA